MSKNLKKHLKKSLLLYVKSKSKSSQRLLSLIRNKLLHQYIWQIQLKYSVIFWHFGCFHIYISKHFRKLDRANFFGKCSNTVSLSSLTTSIPFATWFLPRKCWKWKISLKLRNYFIRIIVMSDFIIFHFSLNLV